MSCCVVRISVGLQWTQVDVLRESADPFESCCMSARRLPIRAKSHDCGAGVADTCGRVACVQQVP